MLARIKSLGSIITGLTSPGWTGTITVPASWPIGWWQQGMTPRYTGPNSAVEACTSAIAQTIASLEVGHFRSTGDGGRIELTNTNVAHVLRRPNDYQTRADFVLNLLLSELYAGNGFALAERDTRGAISALHIVPPNTVSPCVVEQTGDVFYELSKPLLFPSDAFKELRYIPQRDVLHIRGKTPRHPLIGESPITAAMVAVHGADAIQTHISAFFGNAARPSGFLSAPGAIKKESADRLREEWQEATSKRNTGRVAVLPGGLTWNPLTMTGADAALIETYRLTIQDIARVYRVPPQVIGETAGLTYANSESLMRFWLASGLGFMVEHLELALTRFFDLPTNEWISFDIDYLLRTDFSARIDGLVKGVQGGLYSPNEARAREGLPAVAFGNEPRVQAQVVPLSAASKIPASPSAPAAPATPATPAKGADDAKDQELLARIERIEDRLNAEETRQRVHRQLRNEQRARRSNGRTS